MNVFSSIYFYHKYNFATIVIYKLCAMNKLFKIVLPLITLLLVSFTNKPNEQEEVIRIIHKVNHYWQSQNPEHGRAFWDNAVYHTGNMEAYFLTGTAAYKNYSEAWAQKNEWKGAKSEKKAEWKLTYGESENYVLFGDYQDNIMYEGQQTIWSGRYNPN